MPPLLFCWLPSHLFAISNHCSGSKVMGTAAFRNPQSPIIILHSVLAKELTWLGYRSLPRAKLFNTHGKLKKKKVVFTSYHTHLPWLLSLQFLLLLICATFMSACLVCAITECNHVVQSFKETGPLHHQPSRSFVTEEYRRFCIRKDGCLV